MALNASITQGTELLQNSIQEINILGIGWLIGLIITVLVLILITRNIEQWGIYAFPVSMALLIGGIDIALIQIVGTAVMFGISIFQREQIGNFIDSIDPTRKARDMKKEEKVISQKARNKLRNKGIASTLKDSVAILGELELRKQQEQMERRKKKK